MMCPDWGWCRHAYVVVHGAFLPSDISQSSPACIANPAEAMTRCHAKKESVCPLFTLFVFFCTNETGEHPRWFGESDFDVFTQCCGHHRAREQQRNPLLGQQHGPKCLMQNGMIALTHRSWMVKWSKPASHFSHLFAIWSSYMIHGCKALYRELLRSFQNAIFIREPMLEECAAVHL